MYVKQKSSSRRAGQVQPKRLGLPFELPKRTAVTVLRNHKGRKAPSRPASAPAGGIPGFDPCYTDIVDYIVRITDDIWLRQAIGLIYQTYDHACTVYGAHDISRSVEEVVAGTTASLQAFTDTQMEYLNVAWNEQAEGYYTSHLGVRRAINTGTSVFGPATQARVAIHFAADCISSANRIHTEWLVRSSGELLRQLGLDLHSTAQMLAQLPPREPLVLSPETRLIGQMPRGRLEIPQSTVEGWARHLFHDIWNLRRLDWLEKYYEPDVNAYFAGRKATNLRALGDLVIAVQAAMPDAVMHVDHVCHSDEADGTIVAVRWRLEGTLHAGLFGRPPAGKQVSMLGISHLRLDGPRVCEEWVLFDELAILIQAYRP
jgi:predicted ester cyclase